jgi:phage terminase large subunit-like protein
VNSKRSLPDRFAAFAGQFCGLTLEPFQHTIAEEVFSARRELLVTMPRGNGKTSLLAALALFKLLSTPNPEIYACAASRDQARLLLDIAKKMIRGSADLEQRITSRYSELRAAGGYLKVIASDAPLAHGLTPSFVIVDELHAHRDAELYLAMATSLLKRPDAQMVTISTAGWDVDGPLGRLRARALALPEVERQGPLTRAVGPSLAMLEWSAPEDWDGGDLSPIGDANPASWITLDALEQQRQAVHDLAFRRYHANQWTSAESAWLPAGAWQACIGEPRFTEGERIWVGVDVGGERSATAVCWVNDALHVGCEIFQGDSAILDVADLVRSLAHRYQVVEMIFDPWRAGQLAQELEREGMTVSVFPQSDSRMCPASAVLFDAITEKRITLPPSPELAQHSAGAIAQHSRRGWRISKPNPRVHIDGVIALCMAVDRQANQPAPAELLGWI